MIHQLRIGIACYPSVGGSGILATSLGEELVNRGHEVHFFSYERPFRLPENKPGLHFHPVVVNDYQLFRYPDYTLPLSVRMEEVTREHQLDVLHVHYAVPHATAAILARSMLPPALQPRVVTTLHGTDTTLLGRDPGYGPAIRHALTHSDAVTAVSDFLRQETRRLLDFQSPIEVIHNFFAPRPSLRSRETVRAELGVRENETLILHSSNLRPLKRIDLMLNAVALIQPRKAFKMLVLAGGSFDPFIVQVRELGLENRVVVRENVIDIEEYVQASDLFLTTSETESFCLSLLEAMCFGRPGVARRVGGIPEVVEHERSGLLVNGADPAALAAEVTRLILDPDLRNRLGQAAQARARELFSKEAIVPRYERLYLHLVKRLP